MFATVDTLQLWVPLSLEPWELLHNHTGTRVLKIRQATGECLVDFVAGGNVVRESWFAPVQLHCRTPHRIAGRDWFAPFESDEPWVAVQMSVPKVVLGHSLAEYRHTEHSVEVVLSELERIVGSELDRERVLVRRADFCRTLKLPAQELVRALVDHLAERTYYPNRRRYHKEGETLMWAVRNESFKLYAKFPELLAKRGRPPLSELERIAGYRVDSSDGSIAFTGLSRHPWRAQEVLKDAASGQLRFEVTLRPKALVERFAAFKQNTGHKNGVLLPLFLEALDADIGGKIMREEQDKVLSFEKISTSNEVFERLAICVPTCALANNLYRFWEVLCADGERKARELYPRRTYYRYKGLLKLYRIGVLGNDVELERKRRDKLQRRYAELLSHLEGYGKQHRTCAEDEYIDNLQSEAGLPQPRREVS